MKIMARVNLREMTVFEGDNISTMNSVILHKNPRIPPDAHFGDFPHKRNYHFPRIQPKIYTV